MNGIIYLLTILGALAVGSFLNVVIYRLPKILFGERGRSSPRFNLVWPRSQCPHCHTSLLWWHNIPLFSFFILKGRCAFCDCLIHWRYPLVEFVTLVTTLVITIVFPAVAPVTFALLFTWLLIVLCFIDIEHQLLPDSLVCILLWLGLFANAFNVFTPLFDAVMGTLSGYVALWIIALLFKWFMKKEGLGHGDMKLLAALGAWLGWQSLPLLIFASSLACLFFMLIFMLLKKISLQQRMAFGPFLAIAGWCMFVFLYRT